jgi:hypothetical protein
MSVIQNQLEIITSSLSFLEETIKRRFQSFFSKDSSSFTYPDIKLAEQNTPLTFFLFTHKVNIEEYIILLLALSVHLHPSLIDTIIPQYLPNGGEFPEIGGVKGTNHRGTIPTGQTAMFIIAGNDINKRLQASYYFSPNHFFAKENILCLEPVKNGEPRMSGKIILQDEYVDLFTTGTVTKPSFSPEFPAKLVTTKRDWNDLILNAKTMQAINDLKIWMQHNDSFMKEWEMDKKVKPGYRALFYGPSGTGKTLTATLIGKEFNKDVYRIDLSQVVSKYIGETEKNLEKVFNKAEYKDWILFFDEADALFGKRSNVQSAHDKYANQEVSYLLQRVEDFAGLIILSSNLKTNIDQAFVRRFNAIIHFPMPNKEERLALWKSTVPKKAQLADDVDLSAIALKYELSGSAIVSIIHYSSLQTIYRNENTISKKDLIEGIRKEYEKEERVFI